MFSLFITKVFDLRTCEIKIFKLKLTHQISPKILKKIIALDLGNRPQLIKLVDNLFQDPWNIFIILGGGAGCLVAPLVQTDKQIYRTGGTSCNARNSFFSLFWKHYVGILKAFKIWVHSIRSRYSLQLSKSYTKSIKCRVICCKVYL